MLAVSDTALISNFAGIGRLRLLKLQFGELWIPNAVRDELNLHRDPATRFAAEAAFADERIKTDLKMLFRPAMQP